MWIGKVSRRPGPDTVIVTSRAAVRAGVIPWLRATGPLPKSTEFWAVGPESKRALGAAGVRDVRTPVRVGSAGIAAALATGRKRRIAYLRSNRAGSSLVRALRASGHRVTDVVVYEVAMPPPLLDRDRRAIEAADLLVVTSPSGLADLGYRVGRTAFARLAKNAHLVVLGERSRAAAVHRKFRHVVRVPPTGAQPFTRRLLRELRHARV